MRCARYLNSCVDMGISYKIGYKMSITKNVQFQTQGPTFQMMVFISQVFWGVFDFIPKLFQTFIKTNRVDIVSYVHRLFHKFYLVTYYIYQLQHSKNGIMFVTFLLSR